MDDEDCNIRVICRFRPVNQREKDEGVDAMANQIKFQEDTVIEVAEFNGRPAQTFFLDKVFHDPKTTQENIYNLAARKSIDDVIKGYNATIFAYGQTGAGKSFTMFGPDIAVPDLKGIIPRACMHIFEHIANDKEGTEYTIKCSFLEIYKEVIRDLLNPTTNKQGLKVREAPSRGVWVEGLREEYVSCEQDVINLIQLGEKSRAVSATKMNAVSSRSHSLFILTLHQKSRDGSTKEGRLNLADLAGCEKVAKTGASGETLEEAKKINQSLSALGNCINALTKSKKSHIPYRDSKLTFILRESLGGNCKTTLLVACSPHIFNLEETIGTLQFAKRAKSIKNSVKVNKQRSVAELIAIIEKMKKELLYLKKYSVVLEGVLGEEKGPTWKELLPSFADLKPAPSPAPRSDPAAPKNTNNLISDHDQPPDGDVEGETEEPSREGSGDEDEDEKDNLPSSLYLPGDSQEKLTHLRALIKSAQEETAAKVQSLKEEIEILKKDAAPLQESISIKKRIIKELDGSLKDLSSELENAKQQKEKLESRLQFQYTQSKIKKEEQERHIASLSSHNSDLKLKGEKLTAEIDLLTKEIEKNEEDKVSLGAEIDQTAEKIKDNDEKIKRAEGELSEVKAAHKALKNRHFEVTHSLKGVDQKIASQESQISLQQQISAELSTKLAFETEEKERMETELREIEEKIRDYEEILVKAQSELSAALRVEAEFKKPASDPSSVPLKQFDQLKKEKEKLKATMEHLEGQRSQERQLLHEVNDQLTDLLDSHKLEIENTDRLFELQLDNLKMRVELLESQLHDEEEENTLKVKAIEKKIENAEVKYNKEKSSRLALEESLHRKSELIAEKDKLIRQSSDLHSDLDRAISVQLSANEAQEKSLQTLCDRLKALENELKVQLQEKENLEQEYKTALEINVENTKQFEAQLNQARDSMRSKIRVPVKKEQSAFASLFGIKTLPLIEEIELITKSSFALRRSYYLRIWEEKYLILSGNILYIFDSNKPGTRANTEIELNLQGSIVSPANKATGKPNSFGVFQPGKKDNYFQARSGEDATSWINLIQSLITPKSSPRNLRQPTSLPNSPM